MKGENCIDVKYLNSLSIPYLTRFFGSAGQIKKIEKNDNSKYVTIVRPSSRRSLPTKAASTRHFAIRVGFLINTPSKLKNTRKKPSTKPSFNYQKNRHR